MKPKQNYTADNLPTKDKCGTPHYALDALLPYLPKNKIIWEPAIGKGKLALKLRHEGYSVVISGLEYGQDFFEYQPENWDIQVTNPPYSTNLKYPWIERSYDLSKPFALLLPLETLGAKKAQQFFQDEMELILFDKRVNFFMPNKGYGGSAQFPTAWFTKGLNIGKEITYAELIRYPDIDQYWKK